MIMEAIHLSKTILRQEIKKKISNLSNITKNKQSEDVIKKLFDLKQFCDSQRISVYLSTENEVCTMKILEKIFENNKLCYIPRYNKDVMEMVKLSSMEDYEKLPMTKWKIKQPDLNENRENALHSGGLDLIIIPGVAFTKTGKRLGHGKGYYDKFLNNLYATQAKRPGTIALSFKEQIVEDIPCNELDFKIDTVLFP